MKDITVLLLDMGGTFMFNCDYMSEIARDPEGHNAFPSIGEALAACSLERCHRLHLISTLFEVISQ